MASKFQKVALFGKYQAPGAKAALERIGAFIERQGCEVVLESETAQCCDIHHFATATLANIGRQCQLGLVIGGDGTMLGVARQMAAFSLPLIGINQGRLGFITDIRFEDVELVLGPMLKGQFTQDKRHLIAAKVMRDGQALFGATAMNDVVVNRGDVDWILTLAGDTGADGLVILEDVSVPKLTYSAIGTGFANPGFKLIARGVYNLDGVTTPANAKRFISDTAVPGGDITWSGGIDGHGVHGFLNTYNRGADFTPAPLLVGGGLTGTGIGGAASVQTVSLADDASHTFDRRFFNSSRGLILVSVNFDYTAQGVFACGSNGVYQIAAHASDVFQPSTTGSNTDTDGQLNLWFTAGALNVKNRLGGTYAVTVMFLG